MVINPGEITLELLLNNPLYYMLFVYAGALILSAIAAWWADRQADNSLKQESRKIDPLADVTQVYEFENVRDPILAGMLACIAVVFPLAATVDTVGDWQAVFSAAVLAGIASRVILKSLASSFATKVTQKQ